MTGELIRGKLEEMRAWLNAHHDQIMAIPDDAETRVDVDNALVGLENHLEDLVEWFL